MNHAERSNIVYRLLSGILSCCIGRKTYYIHPPTIDILIRAGEVYADTLYTESFDENNLSPYQIARLINVPNIDETLNNLTERQDDLKVDMYDNYLRPEIVDKLRKELGMVRSKLNELYNTKHRYDHMTSEGVALIAQTQFILAETVYDAKHNKVFVDVNHDELDYLFLDRLMGEYNSLQLTHKELREVARTDPWRSYWGVDKSNVFGKRPAELMPEQLALCGYSRLYDNVFESGECPADTVVEDDDLLDGWLIKSRRERERNVKTKEVEKIVEGRHQHDKEIFLPAKNRKQADDIDKLNTEIVQQQKKQRQQIIQKHGRVSELAFPDVQIDLLNQQHKGR